MTESRERRSRGRRKVQFEEVLPSTDLPPLVQGDLRCFLVVDIGKIVWSSTATAQVPPASPAYVRLRWWGETSDGTLFKPASSKNAKPVRCRCRFGVRSGAKQMSAYFVDMGSIVLEVLTSPKAVPLGRIQIPKVAMLSSSNPIHDFFPIISPSSRKIGELQIHIRFKPLEGAYDLTTDTGTDTSMSSRSRPPSEIGPRSRSRGSSVGSRSNRGSARSRSSSTGSRKTSQRRKRSGSRKKGRRRSQSTESNASSASKRSARKGSTIDSSTPRGIDDLLKQNGHDFYGTNNQENIPPKKSNLKQSKKDHVPENKTGNVQNVEYVPPTQDAISALLQRGSRLREDILKSQLDPESVEKPRFNQHQHIGARNIQQPLQDKQTEHINNNMFPSNFPSVPAKQIIENPVLPTLQNLPPKTITPVKEQRQDLDMRFVNLVFGSQEFNGGHSAIFSGFDSLTGSPLSSMISDLDDNPLYDDSLLQQMFYNNNGVNLSSYDTQRINDRLREIEHAKQNIAEERDQRESQPKQIRFDVGNTPSKHKFEDLANRISGLSIKRLEDLSKVYQIRIAIETLAIDYADSRPKTKKGRGKGSKPPMPSPKGKRKNRTYFVEFRFPESSNVQRDHPSSMTTSHDVTRVASRKFVDAEGSLIMFDECCDFQFRFTERNLQQWMKENLDFSIFCRKPPDKKALPVGTATLPLKKIVNSADVEFSYDLTVIDKYKSCGSLKISMELVGDWRKPVVDQYQVEKDTCAVDNNVDKQPVTENISLNPTEQEAQRNETQGSSIAISPSTSVLYMMLMVQEGTNMPGMTIISPTDGTTTHPPNVSLVCRTLTSGESEKTPIVWGQTNPRFDFVQISPLKLDNSLLSRMQNNFIIIEVWTKITSTKPHSDKLLGLVKLPTHHFYQSLKDDEIARVVLNSQHPLISVDEHVPIVDLFTGQERGQLHVTLAFGTQAQISSLRKIKTDIQDRRVKSPHLEEKQFAESSHKTSGPVQHTFEVNILKLDGFKPADNQVWGETDCFIQYQFPTQNNPQESSNESIDGGIDENNQQKNLASMSNYRTDATLCIPDPAFNDSRCHTFHPPPAVPLQRILLSCCYSDTSSGGVPFELWSRYYHPNVRDQLLAKGMLPVAKISSLVSMTKSEVSEQTFHVPLKFVEPEQSHDQSAGTLKVQIKYKSSGTTLESMQPPAKYSKSVVLQVGLLRACGLKAAALLACRQGNDDDMKYCADIGVNTYVEMKPSFLPDEGTRTSRIVAQSFTPEYQHHAEISCPLISYHRDITPVSLAELMISGEIEFSVWHRPADVEEGRNIDTLLGTLNIPMRSLLHKTTGLHSWFALKPSERNRKLSEESMTVGGLEISLKFSCQNDLDLILKAGKAIKWTLPHFETRLLNDEVINDVTGTDCVTFAVTVTNAWLPRNEILLHGRTNIDKNANIYLRYKFFDHDSVTSSLCPLSTKQPHSIDARFENLTSARIAHKKSFVCKRTRPLNWYLREEKLELQIWLTHSKGSKKSRPLDSDKLLGSCHLDLSTIADLQREQHISGSFDLFKAGMDDLGSGKLRVYVSTRPGDIIDPIPDPDHDQHLSENESEQSPVPDKIVLQSTNEQLSDAAFSAVVTIERAMHLPRVHDLETNNLTESNCFVTYDVVDESVRSNTTENLIMVTIATNVSLTTSSPLWNQSKGVTLPRHLLTGTDGALLLKVWHRDRMYLIEESEETDQPKPPESASATTELLATDRMLGFATVDLSVLKAGFRDVNGWYNVLDIHGQCQGQLKVAVTPTKPIDTTQPNTARSSVLPPPSTISTKASAKIMNFLQAPIDVPVQTPSGSMYFPGLQSSAQTVRTTCKMTASEEAVFLKNQDTPQNVMSQFSQDFAQTVNLHQGPSASMFRYTSSDRQQACLVNTLEKQIKELEEIKTKFEHRRAAGFTQRNSNFNQESEETLPKVHTDMIGDLNIDENNIDATDVLLNDNPELPPPILQNDFVLPSKSLSTCKLTTEDKPSQPGVTVLKLHPNRTKSFDEIPDLEILDHGRTTTHSSTGSSSYKSSKSKSTISSHSASEIGSKHEHGKADIMQSKTVHLSLYEPRKNPEFDERALSDNEVGSDVEFVQPRSLNESMCSDLQSKKSENVQKHVTKSPRFDKTSKKPPHKFSVEGHPSQPEPSALTPARSEGHSVLDETSLWLSGSTLRISEFSSDDENEEKIIKANVSDSKEDEKFVEIENKNSENSPQLKDTQQEQDLNDTFTISEEDPHEGTPEIKSNPPANSESLSDSDMDEPPTQNEDPKVHISTHNDSPRINEEEDDEHPVKKQTMYADFSEDDQKDSSSELSVKRSLSSIEDSHGGKSRSTISTLSDPSKAVINVVPSNNCNSNEDEITGVTDRILQSPRMSQSTNANHFEHSQDKVDLNKNPNNENISPNVASSVPVKPTKPKGMFPSFFPPTHDLEASMRALQEATLKHKRDLLKKRESSQNDSQDTPVSSNNKTSPQKLKKIPPKPVDVTDERTQRLARIFRTKFS